MTSWYAREDYNEFEITYRLRWLTTNKRIRCRACMGALRGDYFFFSRKIGRLINDCSNTQ